MVFLDGAVETEAEHDLIVQILGDSMGFSSVVDHIGINEMSIEADEIPGGASEEDDLDRGLFYDRDTHEEAFEAKGGSPLKKTKNDALS